MHSFKIKVGKKTVEFVSGLAWFPLVPDNFKKELRPLADDTQADLYVYRKSDRALLGLTSTEGGAKAGSVPLALVIAEYLIANGDPQNAMVATRLPDGDGLYSFVAVKDGFILSDGDVVASEQDVLRTMSEFLSVGGWDQIICPAAWSVSNSKALELLEMLPRSGSKVKVRQAWRLRPINVAWGKRLLQFGLVAGLLIGAVYAYKRADEEHKASEAARAAAEQAAADEAAREALLNREPWPDIPRAGAFAAACEHAVREIGITAPGWPLVDFACEGETAVVTWTRAGSSAQIGHLREALPSATISADGLRAMVSLKLPLPRGKSQGPEVIPAERPRLEELRDLQARYGIAASGFAEPAQNGQPIQGGETPRGAPPGRKWSLTTMKLESPLSLHSTLQAVDAPGFRINKIRGTIKAGVLKYEIQGAQYAKP